MRGVEYLNNCLPDNEIARMEIEFNTNRVAKPSAGQPVASRSPVRPVDDSVPFEGTRALEQKLKEIPLVRPDKVEGGKTLAADVKYPPTELLDRISSLLAIHSKDS